MTIHCQGKIHKLRISFFKKLGSFWKTQNVHMPGMKALIDEEEKMRDADDAAPMAEEVKLWLPSQVLENKHLFVSKPVLYNTEFQLQEGQCSDALVSIRMKLMAWQHLIRYRNANVVGQERSTRACTLIDTVTDCINTSAQKYRQAQVAMVALCGEESCRVCRRLEPEDIAPMHEVECDAKATKHLGRAGG